MKNLLIKARQEIISLRRRNEILQAQMGIVEVFAAAFGLKRSDSGLKETQIVYAKTCSRLEIARDDALIALATARRDAERLLDFVTPEQRDAFYDRALADGGGNNAKPSE